TNQRGTTNTTTLTEKKNKASECEHCKKTFSRVSALRRHQAKNLKCKLLQATETIEKFKLSR
ncbi:MAG: C2H2-type zinc finger protein, partial [Candidatus Fonsibacter sp.]